MKTPTLEQLVTAAQNRVEVTEWYRKREMLVFFAGMSKSALDNYQKEMEDIPEFKTGIIKPGHSTTFININAFIWYLRWKEANQKVAKKISPRDVLKMEALSQ